ncbi:hypothetical protein GEMRC1_011941 [Eukaryota sp. GEM-RC1]
MTLVQSFLSFWKKQDLTSLFNDTVLLEDVIQLLCHLFIPSFHTESFQSREHTHSKLLNSFYSSFQQLPVTHTTNAELSSNDTCWFDPHQLSSESTLRLHFPFANFSQTLILLEFLILYFFLFSKVLLRGNQIQNYYC